MVLSMDGQKHVYLNVPLEHVEEIIVQEHQRSSAANCAHTIMILSFDLAYSSQLEINGRQHLASLVQLCFEREEDATELRNRIEAQQAMASQARTSISQVLNVSEGGGFMIPDTIAEPEDYSAPGIYSSSADSDIQTRSERGHGQAGRGAKFIEPARDQKPVISTNSRQGDLSTSKNPKNRDPKPSKPRTEVEKAPENITGRRRSPRFQQSSINASVGPVPPNDSVAHARAENAEQDPTATTVRTAPHRSSKGSLSERSPRSVEEAEMANKLQTDVILEDTVSSDSLAQGVHRSPRLTLQSSRSQVMSRKANLSHEKSSSGRPDSDRLRDVTQNSKASVDEYHIAKSTRAATVVAKKIARQGKKAQVLPSKKVTGARVTKDYSAKGKKPSVQPRKARPSKYHEESDIWEIPSDEPKTRYTNPSDLHKTPTLHLIKVKSRESKSKRAAKPTAKVASISRETSSNVSQRRQSTDEYEPSQKIFQAPPATNSINPEGVTRILRSNARNAASRQRQPVSFQELGRRSPIRKRGPRKSTAKANQKTVRGPPRTSQIETELRAAVEESPSNGSELAASTLALSATKNSDCLKILNIVDDSYAGDQLRKLDNQKVPEVPERFSPCHGDRSKDKDQLNEASVLAVSNFVDISQMSPILVKDSKVSANVENLAPRESMDSMSRLPASENEVCSNSSELAKTHLATQGMNLVSDATNQIRDEASHTDVLVQVPHTEDDATGAFYFRIQEIGSDAHPEHLIEPLQEHFNDAIAFTDAIALEDPGVSDVATNEEGPPPAPMESLEEVIIRQSVTSEVNAGPLLLDNTANVHQTLAKDAFASKMETLLQDIELISYTEASTTGKELMQPPESPVERQVAAEASRSGLGSSAAPSEQHTKESPSKNSITVQAANQTIDANSSTTRAINVEGQATKATPLNDKDALDHRNARPGSPKSAIISTSGREAPSLENDEGITYHESKKNGMKFSGAKRKANERAEGDSKRIRRSPPRKYIYATPRRNPAVDVPNGGLATSPLTNDRDKCKPGIISFSGEGPRNQGKRPLQQDYSGRQREVWQNPNTSTLSTASKRKRIEEGACKDQETLEKGSRKRPKHIHFSLPKEQTRSLKIAGLPDVDTFEHSQLTGSQSTRVTSDGSPIASKQFSPDENTIMFVPRIISDFFNQKEANSDDTPFTKAKQQGLNAGSFHNMCTELPSLPDQHMSLSRNSGRPKSGYGKLLPSTPTAPSRMLTSLAAHTVQPGGGFYNLQTRHLLCETKLPDPFAESKGMEIPNLPKPNSFLERLRRSVVPTLKSINEGNEAHQQPSKGQNLNKAQVERKKKSPRRERPQGSSSSSHSSSSATRRTRGRTPSQSDEPGDSPRSRDRKHWRATLEPHQAETRRVLEEMSDVSGHSLMKVSQLIK